MKKITITLDYWTARHLFAAARRLDKSTLREIGAIHVLYDKLERAQYRVKKAAEEDEFGGTHFPDEYQKILTDDLLKDIAKK